jgi:hypothetical protein
VFAYEEAYQSSVKCLLRLEEECLEHTGFNTDIVPRAGAESLTIARDHLES